ncbi:MAG: hypothetical protein Q7T18_08380 [Sedimentisphaerales bacterium]|nr:hypothetical protein [Sedimentisphaerales bacterium]
MGNLTYLWRPLTTIGLTVGICRVTAYNTPCFSECGMAVSAVLVGAAREPPKALVEGGSLIAPCVSVG